VATVATFAGAKTIAVDPVTHNVIQDVYLREAVLTATGVHNRVVADLGRIRDPG